MFFHVGQKYKHRNMLDTYIEVIKRKPLEKGDIELEVKWFTETQYLNIDKITIKAKDRVNWHDITI